MTSATAAAPRSERERVERVAELRALGTAGVPELLEELVEPSWSVRRAVVAALANAGPAAVSTLCDSLRHARSSEAKISGTVDALVAFPSDIDDSVLELTRAGETPIVCDAVQILGRRGSARAVPVLRDLTRHEDDNVALAAVEALGRIGGQGAVESLLPLAESGNFFRAFPAIDVLGRTGDARALPVLLRLLPDPLYGSEAARALGRLGDQSAIAPLVEQLARAGENLIRVIAVTLVAIHARSVQRFGTGALVERALLESPQLPVLRRRMTQSLARADQPEQIALSEALSWIGEESTVPALLALLDGPSEVARVASASLERLAAAAEPVLLEALREGSSARRRLLVPIFGGRLAARDELVGCLGDEDPIVRALACDALAKTSDPGAVPALFRLLADSDLRVSQAAQGAIQSLGSAETKKLALEAAQQSDSRVRSAALRILGYFGYPEGFAVLAAAAADADERVRVSAISGLPFTEHAQALDAILTALAHDSPRTRISAVRALGQMTSSPRVLESLRAALTDRDAWVRYYACQALGLLSDEASTETIAQLLSDASGQVRVAAVDALARLRGPRAFEVLNATMSSGDPDLRRAAMVALGISKRKEALPPLLQAFNAPDAATRLVAVSALAELGGPEAVRVIAQAASDPDPGVRTAAVAFLAIQSGASATSALIELLAKSPSNDSLIQALARPMAGRAQAILIALQNADDAQSSAFVAALARAQTADAGQAIRDALESKNDAARRAAASALVATREPLAARALERAALNDPDPEVRRISATSLPR